MGTQIYTIAYQGQRKSNYFQAHECPSSAYHCAQNCKSGRALWNMGRFRPKFDKRFGPSFRSKTMEFTI